MIEEPQSGTERSCPFCNSLFKRLGNHLQHCPQRNGRDYSCYLSQTTIDKRASHPKKKPCPHCGKHFSRLDTHLKNSAQCTSSAPVPSAPEPSAPVPSAPVPPLATNDQLQDSLSSPLSVHTSDTQASHEPPPDLPILKRREPFNCPKNAEEWLVADEQLAKSVVPEVLAAASVDEKNKALCDGIYTYFTSKYGTRPNKKQKKWKMKASGKALSKLRTERNKLRSEMRKARKAGQDPQAIKDLARKISPAPATAQQGEKRSVPNTVPKSSPKSL